ncbi:hypothetical protein ACIF80_25600 [Streptomyces sp. NPDC085927]|uniref:hypothetical protein n=1 Tax=Streptomyces sp. NPDC085927 TaxID=3365738 RepID=UPI0037D3A014
MPRPDAEADGESGLGLLFFASLADAWGCESHHPGGKTAWAECGVVLPHMVPTG